MSLADEFAGVTMQDWVRHQVLQPQGAPPPLPPPTDRAAMHEKLLKLGFDPFECTAIRYPRGPPTLEQWRAHLQALDDESLYLEERSFDQDSAALVEAESFDTACTNGAACMAMCCTIPGLELRGGIVLQRLPPPHAPLCLLCHRAQIADVVIKDRRNRGLLQEPSELARPGPQPFVLKTLRPIQSFYNLRDLPGEYNGDCMFVGDEGDLLVLPVARVTLKHLRAECDPATGRYRIDQEALRFVEDPAAEVRPGETVEKLIERVSPHRRHPAPILPPSDVDWV